jgi:hypothetical protein
MTALMAVAPLWWYVTTYMGEAIAGPYGDTVRCEKARQALQVELRTPLQCTVRY